MEEAPPASPPSPHVDVRRRVRSPRVWSALTAPVIAWVLAVAVQVVVVVVIVLPGALQGRTPQSTEITKMLGEPWAMIGLIMGSQLCFAAVTFLAALLSPESFRLRLAWTMPPMPWWGWIGIPLGACIPALLGALLAWRVPSVLMDEDQITNLWTTIPVGAGIVYVVMIGLLPGVIEESLFRGYMQRRLIQRWSPALAIGVASAAFALAHLDPKVVVFAFPIGVWLGIVAWKCGSILPGMVAHAFINSAWNTFQILAHQEVLSRQIQLTIGILMLVVCAWAFAATFTLFKRNSIKHPSVLSIDAAPTNS